MRYLRSSSELATSSLPAARSIRPAQKCLRNLPRDPKSRGANPLRPTRFAEIVVGEPLELSKHLTLPRHR
jgi:hypothetical protein